MPANTIKDSPGGAPPTSEGGRRARKLQQTMAHLLACAWRLFEQHGYEAVTMEAIAEAADVARGTLYKYFPAKEALIERRVHDDLLPRRAALRAEALTIPDLGARFLHVFQIEAAYVESMRAYVAPYLHYRLRKQQAPQHPVERDSFESLLADLMRQGQADGEIVTDSSAEQMAEALVFLRLGTLMRWLATPDAPLAPRYAEMIRLFLDGARRRPHHPLTPERPI